MRVLQKVVGKVKLTGEFILVNYFEVCDDAMHMFMNFLRTAYMSGFSCRAQFQNGAV